jgi:hypothetical protein
MKEICKNSATPLKDQTCQAPVARACNPSYSGVRDQEDRSLKPAQANSSM